MATKTDWKTGMDAGTIGNDLTKNNRSGFSALPGGYRVVSNGHFLFGYDGYWWSATEIDASIASNRYLCFDLGYLNGDSFDESCGFSVRLLRD